MNFHYYKVWFDQGESEGVVIFTNYNNYASTDEVYDYCYKKYHSEMIKCEEISVDDIMIKDLSLGELLIILLRR